MSAEGGLVEVEVSMADFEPRSWVRGVVVSWDDEQGVGVVRSDDVPGDVFVHFSMISQPGSGYRSLTPGETVRFTWEAFPQDGFGFRAVEVRRAGYDPDRPRAGEAATDDGAYVSRLLVELDEDDPAQPEDHPGRP
ncbi:hypothetical protein Misp02_42150 [Microtetraspora sp. NBRC 16547]|nr:hypothetical protein Misp02_42150 [Microtetraspora sp. NBRC 16547]